MDIEENTAYFAAATNILQANVSSRLYFLCEISALKTERKIPHWNRSQVQVSLKVTAQIHHLNITVMLDF